MTNQITDRVPGLTADDVDALVAEAQAGYDLETLATSANPHYSAPSLVPEDLLMAVADRAHQDGKSPEDVVRAALMSYLGVA
jgi:hypothetical protein